jgi:histidyl-tRNA synthetase
MSDQTPSPFIDLLPDDHEYLTYLKKVLRHRCRQSGFRRISPALGESAEILQKILNVEESDLEKHAAVIPGQNLSAIRFDPLISIARAYHQHDMKELAQPVELYFIDAFLEKDSLGNLRSEPKFGVQVIGAEDPALTAQVIYLGYKILDDLGLRDYFTVQINHIGSYESRKVYLEDLKNFYFDKQRSMTEEAIKDYERGDLLKLLRNDDEDMQILAQLAPKLENYLNKEDKEVYEQLKSYLDELQVEYRENKSLFGSGQYNAQTVFEFWHNDKGADNIILAGGSNDELVERQGGEKVTMTGFTASSPCFIQTLKDSGIRVPHKDNLQIFVAQLGVNAKRKALALLEQLREAGIQTVGAVGTGSMRAQLDMATDFGVSFTLLMGEVEVNEGMVIVRDMATGTQESVPYAKVVSIMQERIGKEKMDVMEDSEKSPDLK